ncbi:response regulator [Virgibacillus dakarensis]|uniref:Sensory transduction protein LytT n=1 Tax=Lentibacillus populi TaxID=1827502 RepID=A0A9W5X7T2_9BACI|nr:MULTISPECIES: LytTR family DNA-binding domain-containing protein [Bacillaceae]MBT2215635.1 LytTR family DNA-binding domain-containing protein [Virgibacillus dakarensis]MTW85259.1 response regulator [Virgibacillus dakarensis]GGB62466.1 sensory transduction protein LytT [Lentibacillus populi]
MKQIQVLIVDDERYARDELKHLLSNFASIQVVGEADSGSDAVLKALQLQPDVVFLDVEMPKINGMEAAKSLRKLKKVPFIIFATAYPEFAAEAFRLEALDYLLKPYDEDQLKQTVQRIENKFLHSQESGDTKFGKLAIESEGEIHYLFPKEILYIYHENKFSKIVTKKDAFQVKITLKELESRLAPYSFFRIHKSYLVNLNYVSRLTPWFNGAYLLELDDSDEKLSVSRNYVKTLRKRLEL